MWSYSYLGTSLASSSFNHLDLCYQGYENNRKIPDNNNNNTQLTMTATHRCFSLANIKHSLVDVAHSHMTVTCSAINTGL